jgi:thiol peroxidase
MNIERSGLVEFRGKPVTVVGLDLALGQPAPEFTADDQEWAGVKALENTTGKVRIIGSLPSLNTSVCDRETRRFNLEASGLGEEIAIVMVSMDLPYTLRNWCAAAGVDKVLTLSAHKNTEFAEQYGVLLKETRSLRRAIFVVDRQGKIVYAAYMAKIGDEPNYEEVLAAARKALAG